MEADIQQKLEKVLGSSNLDQMMVFTWSSKTKKTTAYSLAKNITDLSSTSNSTRKIIDLHLENTGETIEHVLIEVKSKPEKYHESKRSGRSIRKKPRDKAR